MDIKLVLDDQLGAAVDQARGTEPRVKWIRAAIEMRLANPAMIAQTPLVPRETPVGPVTPLRGGSHEKPPPAVAPAQAMTMARQALARAGQSTSAKRHHPTCTCHQCVPPKAKPDA